MDVNQLLIEIGRGNRVASERLLPLLYDELRSMAKQKMRHEGESCNLQATALVHEAYLRLIGDTDPKWEGKGHFFASAAEAMRRILVDDARYRRAQKRGGHLQRQELPDILIEERTDVDVVALHDALDKLASTNPQAAELVKLRYFAGLTNKEASAILDVSPRKGNQIWAYAKAWLITELGE